VRRRICGVDTRGWRSAGGSGNGGSSDGAPVVGRDAFDVFYDDEGASLRRKGFCGDGLGHIGAAYAKWWLRSVQTHTTINFGGWSSARCVGHVGSSGVERGHTCLGCNSACR
jgi:hypothetical protein